MLSAWSAVRGMPPGVESAELASLLRGMLEVARTDWPGVTLAADVFVTRVAQCVPADADAATLGALHASHLFLATACLAGDDRAIGALRTLVTPAVRSALSRFEDVSGFREDVASDLFERMVVGRGGSGPRLGQYHGRGDLKRWFQVAAARLAVDRVRGRGRREDASDDVSLLDGLDASADPEMRYLEERYRREFGSAFETAVARLTDRDRRLLRERLVHRLGLVQIAKLHDTTKSTAARWVEAARDRLVQGVHVEIADRLSVSESELRSVMKMVRSKIHLSVARVLNEP